MSQKKNKHDTDPNSKNLTPKQQKFVEEYLVDFHVTNAAIRAGYSEKSAYSTGSDNLRIPKIRKAITEAQEKNSKNWIVNVNWVLSQYLNVYDKCMQAEPVLEWDSDTKSLQPTGEFKFDSRGALTALDKIGNHVGFDNAQKKEAEKVKLQIEFKGQPKQLENLNASADEIED